MLRVTWNISSSNADGLAAIVSKLDNLGRDMKKLKENIHAIQVRCQICKGPHLDKECPINEEVEQLEEVMYGEFRCFAPLIGSSRAKFRVGASVNVMPRNIFEYLRLANLRNTSMLVEMADMTKASLGTDNDRFSYDMEKKDHNFTIPTAKIFMIKSDLDIRPQSPACSDNQSRNLRDRSPDDSLQDQSLDEYEIGIGKKGHMLDKIWEYYKDVHRNNTYCWHDHGFEEEERDEIGIEIEKYDPPEVQVETFEVKKYSFKSGQKFFCVTKEVDDALPLGRKNGSRLREMIRNDFDVGAHDETFQHLGENELAQDGDFLDFSAGLLYSEAKLQGVSCSNSTLLVYIISLMYNREASNGRASMDFNWLINDKPELVDAHLSLSAFVKLRLK
ncbi:hypothetical protein Tco_1220284 [Tanacetum coccineum]